MVIAKPANANQNPPAIEWEKYYDFACPNDAIRFIVQTSDGGYALLAHNALSYGYPYIGTANLLKIDQFGNVTWEKLYNYSLVVGGLVQVSDQGYVFANGRYLIKVDSVGNIKWNCNITHNGYGTSMIQTSDGGFVIAGTEGGTHNLSPIWIVKTNSDGKLLWTKIIQSQLDSLSQIIQSKDGDFLVLGYLNNAGGTGLNLLKISPSGSLLWNKTYNEGKSTPWSDKAIVQTSDGGYILVDDTGVATVIKVDMNGEKKWNKTYVSTNSRTEGVFTTGFLNTVILTSDGGLAFAGQAGSDELWILKTDSQGAVQWNQIYGDRDRYGYTAYSLIEANDGSLLIGGEWQSMSRGDYYYLLKTQPFLPKPTPSPTPLQTLPETPELSMQIILPVTIIVTICLIALQIFRHRNTQDPPIVHPTSLQ